MISINNLNFNLKEPILKDINISVKNNNQIIALLGPNGSGKTTLLNIMASHYQKIQGSVEIKGRTFLLPDYAFIPLNKTIKSCLNDFVVLYDTFNVDRALTMLNFLQLDINKKISDYSKGMKEQLHLVFALAQDVDIYLLDEPLAAVDPLTRDILIDLIIRHRKENSIVIISTHLVQDMENLFDEIIMLKSGKIITYNRSEALLDHYSGKNLDAIYKEVIQNEGVN